MAKQKFDINRYVEQLQSLDTQNVGGWPTWIYALCCIIVAGIIIFLGAKFFIMPEQESLERARAEEPKLKQQFEHKQRKVANLDAYKKQLAQMKVEFGGMLKQLPSKAEIANLLSDISQTRAAAGLNEELFQPKGEHKKDFYAEVPVAINVVGSYQQLANFVSGVSSLPRIVTLHNINITLRSKRPTRLAPGEKPPSPDLLMTLTAKTYRYLDENELGGGAK